MWCIFHGGPIDGDVFPVSNHCCTRRMVIYQSGAEPGRAGRTLEYPAVYLRDVADQGEHTHVGLDGISRTEPSIGYYFERYVERELAAKIERVRQADIDADLADGASA